MFKEQLVFYFKHSLLIDNKMFGILLCSCKNVFGDIFLWSWKWLKGTFLSMKILFLQSQMHPVPSILCLSLKLCKINCWVEVNRDTGFLYIYAQCIIISCRPEPLLLCSLSEEHCISLPNIVDLNFMFLLTYSDMSL